MEILLAGILVVLFMMMFLALANAVNNKVVLRDRIYYAIVSVVLLAMMLGVSFMWRYLC